MRVCVQEYKNNYLCTLSQEVVSLLPEESRPSSFSMMSVLLLSLSFPYSLTTHPIELKDRWVSPQVCVQVLRQLLCLICWSWYVFVFYFLFTYFGHADQSGGTVFLNTVNVWGEAQQTVLVVLIAATSCQVSCSC